MSKCPLLSPRSLRYLRILSRGWCRPRAKGAAHSCDHPGRTSGDGGSGGDAQRGRAAVPVLTGGSRSGCHAESVRSHLTPPSPTLFSPPKKIQNAANLFTRPSGGRLGGAAIARPGSNRIAHRPRCSRRRRMSHWAGSTTARLCAWPIRGRAALRAVPPLPSIY